MGFKGYEEQKKGSDELKHSDMRLVYSRRAPHKPPKKETEIEKQKEKRSMEGQQ